MIYKLLKRIQRRVRAALRPVSPTVIDVVEMFKHSDGARRVIHHDTDGRVASIEFEMLRTGAGKPEPSSYAVVFTGKEIRIDDYMALVSHKLNRRERKLVIGAMVMWSVMYSS